MMERETLTDVGVAVGSLLGAAGLGALGADAHRRYKNRKQLAGRALPKEGHYRNGARLPKMAKNAIGRYTDPKAGAAINQHERHETVPEGTRPEHVAKQSQRRVARTPRGLAGPGPRHGGAQAARNHLCARRGHCSAGFPAARSVVC